MAFKTEICNLLESEYPIIQGGMAWTSTAELAAAVSEAGGVGIIGSGSMPADILQTEIDKAKKLTNKNFGVNLMLMHPNIDDIVEVVKAEKISFVTTGAGNPGKYIEELQELGIKVIPVVPSVALAQRVERQGAEALIVEGNEAGGHIGELTTMVLVPQVSQAVKIPVIAAGGIASGSAVIAALALGAKGVQIGTRFICASECTVHENVKQRLIKARDRDTVVTGRSTGHPVRVIRNKLTNELDKIEKDSVPEELEERAAGTLKMAMQGGDVEWGSLMSGQVAGLVKEVKPAADIIKELIDEAKLTIKRLSKFDG
ncbi:hypothetical protein LCGC14_0753250 [marine sediment metagenome]|uniref:Uncharacterized protein n=1 Tax=marine sediment metagenome TaxID=412755 RepID=A0A0F9TAC0_9ZZZZ|nr:enoyl-[acyl-carrier-protein] reductase FabK [Actinomycetota bacterium]